MDDGLMVVVTGSGRVLSGTGVGVRIGGRVAVAVGVGNTVVIVIDVEVFVVVVTVVSVVIDVTVCVVVVDVVTVVCVVVEVDVCVVVVVVGSRQCHSTRTLSKPSSSAADARRSSKSGEFESIRRSFSHVLGPMPMTDRDTAGSNLRISSRSLTVSVAQLDVT